MVIYSIFILKLKKPITEKINYRLLKEDFFIYFIKGTINRATILTTLIIGLIAGPAVSL